MIDLRRTFKNKIPHNIKSFAKRIFFRSELPQIAIKSFESSGCKFEISTPIERHRVISLSDEEEFIRLLLNEIRPGDIYFDIGSCIGMHALHAALKKAYVVAFEPDPSYRKRLKRNIKINGLKSNIKVIDLAISDRKGKTILYTDGVEGNSPSLKSNGARGFVTVKTDTIDNLIAKRKLNRPNLIKLDIEGAEVLALRGMITLLTSHDPPRFLFIELHPSFLLDFNTAEEQFYNLIQSCGYKEIYFQQRSNEIHYVYQKYI